MLSLGRKEVTINILFVVLSYLYMHYVYRVRTSREVLKHMVIPPAALVILFALIEVILQKGQTIAKVGWRGSSSRCTGTWPPHWRPSPSL